MANSIQLSTQMKLPLKQAGCLLLVVASLAVACGQFSVADGVEPQKLGVFDCLLQSEDANDDQKNLIALGNFVSSADLLVAPLLAFVLDRCQNRKLPKSLISTIVRAPPQHLNKMAWLSGSLWHL